MASIKDISIIDSNKAQAHAVASGLERMLCGPSLCGSKTLTVYRRTVLAERAFDLHAGDDYHVVYAMEAPANGVVHYRGEAHDAQEGAGVLLVPGESARFEVSGSSVDLLHMVVPKPPSAVEEGLPGGPGYYFDRGTLRVLSDASGGRVRRFCAESSVRLLDGARLTPTNAIQAGEMHYIEGGSSPYHSHVGTSANPEGPAHCYMTFKGRGTSWRWKAVPRRSSRARSSISPRACHTGSAPWVDRWTTSRSRPGEASRPTFSARSPWGLRWYYERENPDADLVEWNQS